MIEPPERSPERDAALEAMLPHIGRLGWTSACLRQAMADLELPDGAALLFPGGPADMVEAFCDLADRRMEQAAAGLPGKLAARVRGSIALRLQQHQPHKEAVRRAASILAHPRHAPLAARATARTVDAIWHAAGDRSADFSWYTKRAILVGIYTATVLFWLRDTGADDAATLAFLDRRLAGVARLGRWRRRLRPASEPPAAPDVAASVH